MVKLEVSLPFRDKLSILAFWTPRGAALSPKKCLNFLEQRARVLETGACLWIKCSYIYCNLNVENVRNHNFFLISWFFNPNLYGAF